MSKEHYDTGLAILNECAKQINVYQEFKLRKAEGMRNYELECFQRTKEIGEAIDTWNDDLRDLLQADRLVITTEPN